MSTAIVSVSVDADGNVEHDAIVKQAGTKVYSKFTDLVQKDFKKVRRERFCYGSKSLTTFGLLPGIISYANKGRGRGSHFEDTESTGASDHWQNSCCAPYPGTALQRRKVAITVQSLFLCFLANLF